MNLFSFILKNISQYINLTEYFFLNQNKTDEQNRSKRTKQNKQDKH